VAFASEIAAKLPADKPVPAIGRLPAVGPVGGAILVPGSVRLGRGPIALQSFPVVGDGDVLLLRRRLLAVAGDYAADRKDDAAAGGKSSGQPLYSLVVVDYPDEAAAREALAFLRASASPAAKTVPTLEGLRLTVRIDL
jgi:hypothetical protein